jgi:type I restriction enzyme, S subunit
LTNLATIEKAFEFVRNGTSIKQQDGATGIPITRIETIWNSTVDKERFGYANIEDIADYKNHLLQDGDILMSHINSPKHLGKCAIYKNDPNVLIHGMNLLNLRPNKTVLLPQFAFYYLSSNSFRQEITKISNKSVNQASFSTTGLKKLKIPLPPLAEQQKIAAILDAADSLRQKDQQLVERYTTLSQSLFLEMFGDPLQNPQKWKLSALSSLVKAVIDCPHTTPRWTESGKVAIRTSNLTEGGWIWDDKRYVSEQEFHERSARAYVKSGDIVLSREGTVGVAAIVNHDMEICLGQRLVQIQPNLQLANNHFLLNLILYELAPERIETVMVGATSKHLNLKDLRSMKLITPPISLQNLFADRIKLIKAQKQQAQASLQKAEALFNSLLQQAFTGELTRAPMERAA